MANLDHLLAQELADISSAGLRRVLRPARKGTGTVFQEPGHSFLNFASNDYLGLASHPAVIESALNAVQQWGAGSGASRLISGSLQIHHDLEDAISAWKGTESSLTFSSGFATALGVIPALVGTGDTVILDKRVHACCVDAARLSGATLRIFRHNDLDSLESILTWANRRRSRNGKDRILIVTESVFSMDGDQAPLAAIIQLKERYGAWLMLDEAHASGLFGVNRSGLARATESQSRIEIQMGTLGKALGSAGGYVAGSRTLVEYLTHKARSFLFSTAPVPAASGAALAGLSILQSQEGARRCERTWEWARMVASHTQPHRPPSSAILPVILGTEERALEASSTLRESGIYVPAIRFPTVSRGSARLRITLNANHTSEQINCLIQALVPILRPTA